MPQRIIRNTAVLAKIESVYATDPVPTGGANAMLVSTLSINPINAQYVDRDIIRPFIGASEQLLGTRNVELGFDIELVGAGTVATAPAWAPLMRACGFAETISATYRTDYSLVSTGFESVTIYWYDDGVLHKATGCRGSAMFKLQAGGRPVMSFTFKGLYSTPTAASNPAVTLTAFKVPQTVIDANSGDVMFGGTHATGSVAPAITGGTGYPSQGLEIDLGNEVNFTALLGGETVDITNRSVKGKVTLDLTAAQEVSLISAVEAATLQTIGLQHGTVANNKVLVWLAAAQLTNPQKAEVNGKRLVSFDIRATPTTAGNDEFRLVTSF